MHRIPRNAQLTGFHSQIEKLFQKRAFLHGRLRPAVDPAVRLLHANDPAGDDRAQLDGKVRQSGLDRKKAQLPLMRNLCELRRIRHIIRLKRSLPTAIFRRLRSLSKFLRMSGRCLLVAG